MGLKQTFESLLRMGKVSPSGSEGPVSIVLLLREPRFPTLELLREGAGRAFGTGFTDDRTARHSVYQRGALFTLANVGEHTLSFLFMTRPYLGDDPEHARRFEKSLRRDDQRQAWAAHTSYMAIDYVKGGIDNESKYAVLAKLGSELYDNNCEALYLPKERALIPGDTAARNQLNKIIASRNVNVS
jgi:hypothetical protein